MRKPATSPLRRASAAPSPHRAGRPDHVIVAVMRESGLPIEPLSLSTVAVDAGVSEADALVLLEALAHFTSPSQQIGAPAPGVALDLRADQ